MFSKWRIRGKQEAISAHLSEIDRGPGESEFWVSATVGQCALWQVPDIETGTVYELLVARPTESNDTLPIDRYCLNGKGTIVAAWHARVSGDEPDKVTAYWNQLEGLRLEAMFEGNLIEGGIVSAKEDDYNEVLRILGQGVLDLPPKSSP